MNAQKDAIAVESAFTMPGRFALAANILIQNTFSFYFPFNLSAFYSYPDNINGQVLMQNWICLGIVLALVVFAFLKFKKKPLISFSFLWIIAASALTLQLIPVGSALRADRYMYLPSIGYALLLVNFLSAVLKNKSEYAIYIYLILFSVMTFHLDKRWKTSMTLYNSILDDDQSAWLILNNRAALYMDEGNEVSAIHDYERAMQINPKYYLPYCNLGNYYKEKGEKYTIALKDFDAAIQLDLQYAMAYRNRGLAHIYSGSQNLGCEDLRLALALGDQKSNELLAKHCGK
jgi:tetratricopeptide (TPR) repeat protein